MDIREFNHTVKRVEGPQKITIDVSPLGKTQAEAIETYLQKMLLSAEMGLVEIRAKRTVL